MTFVHFFVKIKSRQTGQEFFKLFLFKFYHFAISRQVDKSKRNAKFCVPTIIRRRKNKMTHLGGLSGPFCGATELLQA